MTTLPPLLLSLALLCASLINTAWAGSAHADVFLLDEQEKHSALGAHMQDLGLLPLGQSPKALHMHQDTASSQEARWYKISLKNTAKQTQWVIATSVTQALLFNAYGVSQGKVSTLLHQDRHSSFGSRTHAYNLLVVPVTLLPGESLDVYIQYQSIASYPLFSWVHSEEKFEARMLRGTLLNGTVLGAFILLMLFFFVQFLITPSPRLGYYCMLTFSVVFFIAQLAGYCFKYLWPDSGEFNIRFTSVIGGFTYIWYFLFTAALFNLNTHHKPLYHTLMISAGILACLITVGFFIDVSAYIIVLALVVLPLPVVVAVWALKRRLASSLLFFIGSTLHCTFTYAFILTCMGVTWAGLGKHVFIMTGLGQLVDICLFATAIIYQSKVVRDQLNQHLLQKVADAEDMALLEKEKLQSTAKLQDYILQLAAVSHDLTQPLAAMKMALAVVDDNESKAAKHKIQHTIAYAEDILRSMINTTKSEYLETKENVKVEQVFSSIVQRYEDRMASKNLTLRTVNHHCDIRCSSIVINRILDNLVSNAMRHTQQGGILIAARQRKAGVLIQVWDTGCGIAQAHMNELSRPFTPLNQASGGTKSSGLGLYIVKALCDNAGYPLKISSKQGHGTCISLMIT